MNDKTNLHSVFHRADQSAVRADLAAFFGPRPEPYLRYFEKRSVQVLAGRRGLALSWSWPAFSAWTAWFWYRKMWRHGLLAILIPTLADWIPMEFGGLVAYLLVVSQAKEWYLHLALGAILQADAKALTGDERLAFLRQRGCPSPLGGVAGALLVIALTVIPIYFFLPDLLDQLSATGLLPGFP